MSLWNFQETLKRATSSDGFPSLGNVLCICWRVWRSVVIPFWPTELHGQEAVCGSNWKFSNFLQLAGTCMMFAACESLMSSETQSLHSSALICIHWNHWVHWQPINPFIRPFTQTAAQRLKSSKQPPESVERVRALFWFRGGRVQLVICGWPGQGIFFCIRPAWPAAQRRISRDGHWLLNGCSQERLFSWPQTFVT